MGYAQTVNTGITVLLSIDVTKPFQSKNREGTAFAGKVND